MSILHELNRIQEVVDIISEQTKDSTSLPQSGEQVLLDLKSSDTTSIYQVTYCFYINVNSTYSYIFFVKVLLACTNAMFRALQHPEPRAPLNLQEAKSDHKFVYKAEQETL